MHYTSFDNALNFSIIWVVFCMAKNIMKRKNQLKVAISQSHSNLSSFAVWNEDICYAGFSILRVPHFFFIKKSLL